MFDYQGQCDYLLAKGFITLADSFEVIIQVVDYLNNSLSNIYMQIKKSLGHE